MPAGRPPSGRGELKGGERVAPGFVVCIIRRISFDSQPQALEGQINRRAIPQNRFPHKFLYRKWVWIRGNGFGCGYALRYRQRHCYVTLSPPLPPLPEGGHSLVRYRIERGHGWKSAIAHRDAHPRPNPFPRNIKKFVTNKPFTILTYAL